MFNLFGKKSTPDIIVSNSPSKKQYPQVVEDIHNEFFTAGDNILQEATCLLKELETKDLAKGKRLAALGFGKTREAVVAIETENRVATTKEIAELVMDYRIHYPNNKFITEEQVKQICGKYGLVLGETSMYKGFVPENKLSLIERFKLNKKHGSVFYKYGTTCKTLEQWYNGGNSINFVDSTIKSQSDIYTDVESLKICAPLKDMDVSSRQQVVGYKIQDIPDPVVLQPCKGGYLIVCAWGDEASDEIVVNEINN